jgi:hypothetical protein
VITGKVFRPLAFPDNFWIQRDASCVQISGYLYDCVCCCSGRRLDVGAGDGISVFWVSPDFDRQSRSKRWFNVVIEFPRHGLWTVWFWVDLAFTIAQKVAVGPILDATYEERIALAAVAG